MISVATVAFAAAGPLASALDFAFAGVTSWENGQLSPLLQVPFGKNKHGTLDLSRVSGGFAFGFGPAGAAFGCFGGSSVFDGLSPFPFPFEPFGLSLAFG